MITREGWFDWMKRDPGPPHKVNGGRNGGKGIIPHSAEGYARVLREILFGPRRASWGASILKNDAFQHYPVWAQTWTSGSSYPNNNFFAFEVEGCGSVPGIPFEPWTPFQTLTVIRMARDLREVQGWTAKRPVSALDTTASCYEHNECVRWGSEYTSCPSGRNPWDILIPAINAEPEEDDMKPFMAWDLGRKAWYFVGPAGARWVTTDATIVELEKQFGPLERKALSTPAIQALGG